MRLGAVGCFIGTVVILGSCPGWGRARADTVVLSADADTSLFFAAPGGNLGASDSLAVGGTGHEQPGRGLIRFPVAGAIPSGAIVTGATLAFVVTKAPAGAVPSIFSAHRMLRSWTEGRGAGNLGEPAVAGESTWNHRAHLDAAWGAPGGEAGVDFAVAAGGSVPVDGPGRYSLGGDGLVADVQEWVTAPESNHGWLLMSDAETQALTARRIGTRESAGVVATLTVEFETAAGTAPVLTRWGRVGDRFELEFRGEPGNLYQVQYQDALLPAGSWQALTNIVVKLVPSKPVVSERLSEAAARFYRVADVGDVD